MQKPAIIMNLVVVLMPSIGASTVEEAPKIIDREIGTRLMKEGQKAINNRIDELERSLNKCINPIWAEINDRFNILQWMLELFITISLVILGFMLRMQWQMQKSRQAWKPLLTLREKSLTFLKVLLRSFFLKAPSS